MSGSITRPLGDNWPSVEIEGNGHSTSTVTKVDNSTGKRINDWGPWVTVCAIIASLSLGLSVSSIVIAKVYYDRATISENHWRSIEGRVDRLEDKFEDLKHAAK